MRISDWSSDVCSSDLWKTVALDESSGDVVAPNGSIGFRWGEDGKWNIHPGSGAGGAEVKLRLSLIEGRDDAVAVQFPYFGGSKREHFKNSDHADVLSRNGPVRDRKSTRLNSSH